MISSKPPHILVFDSGVGGLSIVEAVKKAHPSYRLTYASDNAQFPYGTKSESVLIERVERVLSTLQEEIAADIILVACNTASTLVLPKIRSHFTQPIIGVVPAIKPAAEMSKNKTIGLLATPGTVERQYTKELIKDFAHECDVISVGSSELVLLAEQKLQNKPVSLAVLTSITAPFRDTQNRPDTIVLACTHFPLLKEELQLVLPNITYWVDSGEAIARRVQFWVNKLNLVTENTLATASSSANGVSIFTKQTAETELIKPTLNQLNLGLVHYTEVS